MNENFLMVSFLAMFGLVIVGSIITDISEDYLEATKIKAGIEHCLDQIDDDAEPCIDDNGRLYSSGAEYRRKNE